MFKINGTEFEGFTEYNVTYQKITEGERDSTGKMHLDLVARKKKIQLKWEILSQQEATALLSKFDELLTFTCTYFDPKTGKEQSIIAYCNDPSIDMIVFSNGIATYKGFSVNIIEM